MNDVVDKPNGFTEILRSSDIIYCLSLFHRVDLTVMPLKLGSYCTGHWSSTSTCVAFYTLLCLVPLKADSHIACRAHAVPLPCRAAKGL
jgi:hypothetical protein